MRQPNVHFTSVSFVPGSPSMLAAGTHSTHAMAWRESEDLGAGFPESFELECSSRIREEYGEEDFSVRGATFADSGKRFAASTYEGYVCIWDRRESPAANGKLWQVVAAIQVRLSLQYARG